VLRFSGFDSLPQFVDVAAAFFPDPRPCFVDFLDDGVFPSVFPRIRDEPVAHCPLSPQHVLPHRFRDGRFRIDAFAAGDFDDGQAEVVGEGDGDGLGHHWPLRQS
jgi:hypothetical protein